LLYDCKNGDVLGHGAVFSDEKYSSSAVALEDSSVCFIPSKVLTDMIETDPNLPLGLSSSYPKN